MRRSNVIKVLDELVRCKAAVDEAISSNAFQTAYSDYFHGSESASLRRASMDLTKALTRLRNER